MSEKRKVSVEGMIKPDFDPLEETLLIPLLGRAKEMNRINPLIRDQHAVNIISSLDYDFGKFDNEISSMSMARTTLRTAIIDHWVKEVLRSLPYCTIVELGCGLNTRFSRVDNDHINWYDLDTPRVFEVWKQFFTMNLRKRFLPFSAFDNQWHDEVRLEHRKQIIIIAEASVIYFPALQVEALIRSLRNSFPGAWYIFDSASRAFVSRMELQDALRYCSARFNWVEEDSGSFFEDASFEKRLDLERALSDWLSHDSVNLEELIRKCMCCPGKDSYYLNLIKLE